MEPKEAPEQSAFNFEGEPSFEVSGEYCPLCSCQSADDSEERYACTEVGTTEVVSISERVAAKEEEKDRKLFEGILSRVKHLEF